MLTYSFLYSVHEYKLSSRLFTGIDQEVENNVAKELR